MGLKAEEDSESQAEVEVEAIKDDILANAQGVMDPTEISLNVIIGRISCSTLQLAGSIHFN